MRIWKLALVGLLAIGGAALTQAPASARPMVAPDLIQVTTAPQGAGASATCERRYRRWHRNRWAYRPYYGGYRWHHRRYYPRHHWRRYGWHRPFYGYHRPYGWHHRRWHHYY